MFKVGLTIREPGDLSVVALCGELSLADVPCAASHLIAAVAAHGPSMIVDLTGLEYLCHSGLEVLVRVLKWTRESGGDLRLAARSGLHAPQQPVRRVLEASGLIDVFSVSVAQAAGGAKPGGRRYLPMAAVLRGRRQPARSRTGADHPFEPLPAARVIRMSRCGLIGAVIHNDIPMAL
jgi:anti-sigma B factor antagonist